MNHPFHTLTRTSAETGITDEMLDAAFHELRIHSAGVRAERAMNAGDRTAARRWEEEQRRLIGLRSPQQIARMEADIDRAIQKGDRK